MGKRTMTESEVHARTKNRHEEQALQSKLRSLHQAHLGYLESLGKTRQEIVKTRRSGVRTTGTSPMPRDLHEDGDVGGNESTMTLICSHFRRPWAYTFSETSHNAVYREACMSASRDKMALRRSSAPPLLHGRRAASALPNRTYSRASLPAAHARCASAWDDRRRSLHGGGGGGAKSAEPMSKTSTDSSETSSGSKQGPPQRYDLHVYVPSDTNSAACGKDNAMHTSDCENGCCEDAESRVLQRGNGGREGSISMQAHASTNHHVHYQDEGNNCEGAVVSEEPQLQTNQVTYAEPQRRGFYSVRPPPLLNSTMNRRGSITGSLRRPKSSVSQTAKIENGELNHTLSTDVSPLSTRPKSSVSFQNPPGNRGEQTQSTTTHETPKNISRPKSSFVRMPNSPPAASAENGSSCARPKSSVVYGSRDKHDNQNGEVSPTKLRARSSVVMSRGRRLPEMPGNMTTASRYSYPNKTSSDESSSSKNGEALTEEQKAFAKTFKSEVAPEPEVESEDAAEPMAGVGFGHVTLHRGRRIRNYVRPQDRHRVDPFRLERRERLLTKLSIENPAFLSSLSTESKTGDVFPKSARQRAMRKLIALNEEQGRQAERYDRQEELQARIAQFLQSMEAYCLPASQPDKADT